MLRSVLERVCTTEYCRIGSSRRFRAVQRRRTRAAVRVSMLVVAGVYAFDAIASGEHGPILVALDVGVIGLALGCWWSQAHWGRHHPELAAWILVSGIVLSTAVTGVAVPDLVIQSTGYLLILPGLVALLLPWRTSTHLAWLVAYAAAAAGYLALVHSDVLTPHLRGDLATVLVVAIVASLAGHVLLMQTQIRNFAQMQRILALHRQGENASIRLARADDALRTLETTAQHFEQRALHDPLTGLANRTLLGDRLVHALAQRGTTVAFIMLDLDDFKTVNDRLGHAAGDEVLQGVARRLTSALRSGDTLARVGGDEFAVVSPGVGDTAAGCAIADRLLGSLRTPLRLEQEGEGVDITARVSAGIALVAAGECAAEELMRRADLALYLAKDAGKDQWRLFDG